jgi:hypothetical protein
VVVKPLATDPVPEVSIVAAWKRGNGSALVRTFLDLVRQAASRPKDVRRLTGRTRKS